MMLSLPRAAAMLPLWYRISQVMVSSDGSASTSSVDMLRYKLLPPSTTPKKSSATIDGEGRVVVCDSDNNRVQVLE
jgi:hypothetical protein